jgi:hypothetical protein
MSDEDDSSRSEEEESSSEDDNDDGSVSHSSESDEEEDSSEYYSDSETDTSDEESKKDQRKKNESPDKDLLNETIKQLQIDLTIKDGKIVKSAVKVKQNNMSFNEKEHHVTFEDEKSQTVGVQTDEKLSFPDFQARSTYTKEELQRKAIDVLLAPDSHVESVPIVWNKSSQRYQRYSSFADEPFDGYNMPRSVPSQDQIRAPPFYHYLPSYSSEIERAHNSASHLNFRTNESNDSLLRIPNNVTSYYRDYSLPHF